MFDYLVDESIKDYTAQSELETLIKAVRIYSQDIGMEFGTEKCTMLRMKSGKRHMTEGME